MMALKLDLKSKGLRKFVLGMTFLILVFILAMTVTIKVDGEHLQNSFIGLASLAGAISLGMFTLVYGYNQEHKHNGQQPPA